MNSQNRARGGLPFIALASVLCLLSGNEVWAGPGETTSGIGGSGFHGVGIGGSGFTDGIGIGGSGFHGVGIGGSGFTDGIGGSRLERYGRSGIGGSGFSRFRMDQRFRTSGGIRTSGIGGSGIARMGMRRGPMR